MKRIISIGNKDRELVMMFKGTKEGVEELTIKEDDTDGKD
jgi:hypothetical protein